MPSITATSSATKNAKPAPKQSGHTRQEGADGAGGMLELAYLNARNVVLVRERNFYRIGFIAFGVWAALMTITSFTLFLIGPQSSYFATSPNGVITPLQPLNRPMLAPHQISSFTSEAVTTLMSVDFVSWRKRLSDSSEYYTQEAFSSIEKELESGGFLEDVRRNFYVSSAVPTAAPIIVRQGLRGGVYTWEVQFPLRVTLTGKNGSRNQEFKVTAFVERAPASIKPRNLAVSKLVLG